MFGYFSELKILMEMFTCSGSSSGPHIFNFGTAGSDIQSHWRRQENFLICVGKNFLAAKTQLNKSFCLSVRLSPLLKF